MICYHCVSLLGQFRVKLSTGMPVLLSVNVAAKSMTGRVLSKKIHDIYYK